MVSRDNRLLFYCEETAGASTVGYLRKSYREECAWGHGMSAVFAHDMVHGAKGEVTILASVGGTVVDQLERT